MKHMKFKTAEYILGIQRLHNEVFTEDSKTLCVSGDDMLNHITAFMCDEIKASSPSRRRCYSVNHTGVYHKVILHGPYHWEYNLNDDEIILVKGYDRVYIVDELGNPVAHNYDITTAEQMLDALC